MFYQIDTSSDQKVIGVNNGIYQVEIDENDLKKKTNSKEIEDLFFNYDINYFLSNQEKVFNLKIENVKGKLLNNANLTDVMGFSPYAMGFKYIVSRRFIDCLMEIIIDKNQYNLIPITIGGVSDEYYLLFIPMIPSSEIIFSDSILYPESEFLSKKKNYYKLENYSEYCELIKTELFNRWERIKLKKQYESYDILNIQAVSQMFFSERLTEKLFSKNITNLTIKNNIKLVFEK